MKMAQLNLRVRITGLKGFRRCSTEHIQPLLSGKSVVIQVQLYYTHIQFQGIFLQSRFQKSMSITAPLQNNNQLISYLNSLPCIGIV